VRVAALAAVASLWLLPADGVRADVADGIVWGGSTHVTKEELGAWLAQRGASYTTWAERHPWAADRLEGDEVAPPPPEVEPPVEASVAAPVSSRESTSAVALLTLALATVLLGVAALPRALLPAAFAGPYQSWRLVAAAGGIAVLVGLAVVVLTATPP
jgi:hypothetical protein